MAFENGPYLAAAVFCESVIEDKQGIHTLVRVVDRLFVDAEGVNPPDEMPAFPLNWTLFLSLKSGEVRGSHQIKIVPTLPSEETLAPITLDVYFEGANKGSAVIGNMGGLQLEMPGLYWFKVYFGEEFLTQVPIEVIYRRKSIPQISSNSEPA